MLANGDEPNLILPKFAHPLYFFFLSASRLASYADVLRLVTRSSPRTSAQRTGHIRSLAVSQSKRLCLSAQSWTLTDFDLTLQHEKFVPQMFNILTYVRVAPATADVHIILEVPATDIKDPH